MRKRIKLRERCRCPNNTLFILALLSLIMFLFLELIFRIYILYRSFPLVDVPSHFAGGVAFGVGIFWIVSLTLVKRKYIWTVILAFLSAVVWEVLETLEELVFESPPYLKDIFFWDGFWDIIVTVIGATFALFVLKRLGKRLRLTEVHRHGCS